MGSIAQAHSMSSGTLAVTLLSIAVLALGCATPDPRLGHDGYRYGSASSNEGYYGIIDSIDATPAARGGHAMAGSADGGAVDGVVGRDNYAIRIRFDDSSYRTVTQVGLDGLRVGDSVRIERDRVRHY
jgi:hypothetical protein